jgi:hypothetical protein
MSSWAAVVYNISFTLLVSCRRSMMFKCLKYHGFNRNIPVLYLRRCHDNKKTDGCLTFKDIPGPKSYPIIGTLYQYMPFIGKLSLQFLFVKKKGFNISLPA